MQPESNTPGRSNVIKFPIRKELREANERRRGAEDKIINRAAQRRRDASSRAARMKAKRAGGFAPPVNPDNEGDYITVEMEYDGLSGYGYPAGTKLLVRTDVEAPLGRLAACERADNGAVVVGAVVRDSDGNLRIDSLTCGMFGYGIKRVIGPVLGPLASEAETEYDRASEPTDAGLDWPEYIDVKDECR